jgi:hypothetical protein
MRMQQQLLQKQQQHQHVQASGCITYKLTEYVDELYTLEKCSAICMWKGALEKVYWYTWRQ